MPPVTVLIKPSSGNCNMRCNYCFHHDLAKNRTTESFGFMTSSTLEALVIKTLEYGDYVANFAFQGGEPTLIGLDFYEEFVSLVKKYNTKYLKVSFSIQTNGMNIDARFAKFLHNNHFLVGLSLDGPKDINDKYRVDLDNRGTFERIMAAKDMLDLHRVEYNILSVVTNELAQNARYAYRFFKKNKLNYLQFIPCLDPIGTKETGKYLSAQAYAKFLKEIFDLWYVDLMNGTAISIRYFDNLATMAAGYRAESCGMSGKCECYFTVEADGSVYPCDFYVTDEWKLGNINTDSMADMINAETAQKFKKISEEVDKECIACPHFNLCRGGCRRYREPFVNSALSANCLCEAFKTFFDYADDGFERIAKKFIK